MSVAIIILASNASVNHLIEDAEHVFEDAVRSVNFEFYHNLLCRGGGVYDVFERICPWLKGAQRRTQQDGARPHTSEG